MTLETEQPHPHTLPPLTAEQQEEVKALLRQHFRSGGYGEGAILPLPLFYTEWVSFPAALLSGGLRVGRHATGSHSDPTALAALDDDPFGERMVRKPVPAVDLLTRAQLDAYLDRLPYWQHAALYQVHVLKVPQKDVAQKLKCSVHSVSNYADDALHALGAMLFVDRWPQVR